ETSSVQTIVTDRAGDPVVGDRVSFSSYAVSDQGSCGSFDHDSALTDANGSVVVTYTGSSDSVTCALVALDARGGHSALTR
ncbi:hypothetical protein SB717_38935, partial [Priestia sp. SIMBA_032]